MVESWTFRLVGAPDALLARTLMYSRLVNAPTSVVGHDDLEMYERAQESLSLRRQPLGQHAAPLRTRRNAAAAHRSRPTAPPSGRCETSSAPGRSFMADGLSPADPVAFVVHEARLIDEQRFSEWLDLFAEDGRYWMPLRDGPDRPHVSSSRCSTTTSCSSVSASSVCSAPAPSARSRKAAATTSCKPR